MNSQLKRQKEKFMHTAKPIDMKKLSETYRELRIVFTYPIQIRDSKGNVTYFENSHGYWCRKEYDSSGNEIYYENSDGYWYKREYDSDGNMTYFEDSEGDWYKSEYDSDGNETYSEDSHGNKQGTKRSSCDGKVIEIDGIKYKLTAVKDYEYKAPEWVNWPV